MKKKKSWIIVGSIVLLVVIFGTVIKLREPRTIHSFYSNQPEKITKIVLMSGNTGNTEDITDPDKIKQVTDYFETIRLKKVRLEPSTGWSYRIIIYEGDNEVMSIVDGVEHYSVNGADYNVEAKERKAFKELLGSKLK